MQRSGLPILHDCVMHVPYSELQITYCVYTVLARTVPWYELS